MSSDSLKFGSSQKLNNLLLSFCLVSGEEELGGVLAAT